MKLKENDMKTIYNLEFLYEGFSVNPDDITKFLSVPPDEVCKKGDIIREIPKLLIVKENSWSINSKNCNLLSFENHLEYILNRIKPSFELFYELSKKCKPILNCIIKIYKGDRPLINVSRENLHELSKLNVELTFDIYNYD